MKKLIVMCCLLCACTGCSDDAKKARELEAIVQHQARVMEAYQNQLNELRDIKEQMAGLQKFFNGVMRRLDALDEKRYQGTYIKARQDLDMRGDDLLDGYVQLIDRLERDAAPQ